MSKIFLSLRAAAYYLAMSLSALFFTLLIFIMLILPFRYGRKQLSRAWCYTCLVFGKWICGMKYQVIGLENCPASPVIFLSKHQSAWETITLPAILPPLCCVSKEALLNIPLFGWSMRVCKHIPIDRKSGISAFKKVIRLGKERLAEGLSVLIFPEGTRVPRGQNPKFHKTAVSLAIDAKVPVIPIAHNSGSCWTRNSFIKTPGTITVVIGKPIESIGKKNAELNDEVYEWIKSEMKKLESASTEHTA